MSEPSAADDHSPLDPAPRIGPAEILDRALAHVPGLPTEVIANVLSAAVRDQHRVEALKEALRGPANA